MWSLTTVLKVVALCLSIVTGSASQVHAADTRLWTTAFASSGNCRAYFSATGPEQFSTIVTGFSWPMPKGGGAEFIDRTILHLNAAAAGRANNKAFLERLLTAANTDAYTRLDFGARGGPSPSFLNSVMVIAIAHSVSYLNAKNAISAADIKVIDRWVRVLLQNSTKKSSSTDHDASIATANLTWGAAIGDQRLFRNGISSLDRVMGKINNTPKFDDKVRMNTETLPIVLMAAHVLRLNGIDYFSKRFGKHNLHDVVAYHAAWVNQTGTKKVETEAIRDSEARSIMRSDGWGAHQAWIPLYLAHFPKTHAAADVRALHAQVKRAHNGLYYGRNMGVHSACYFGLR
jgi:hypothetical protein